MPGSIFQGLDQLSTEFETGFARRRVNDSGKKAVFSKAGAAKYARQISLNVRKVTKLVRANECANGARTFLNRCILRRGDKIVDGHRDGLRDRNWFKSWDPSAVQRVAGRHWRYAGPTRSSTGTDIEKTSHMCELVSATSQCYCKAQSRAIDAQLTQPCKVGFVDGVYIGKGYDATPQKVMYGALASTVMHHARYFVKIWKNGSEKWVSMNYAEYVGHTNRARPGMGVLDLFALRYEICIAYVGGSTDAHDILLKPVFLQNGKGSSIFRACELAEPALSIENIIKLAEFVPYIVVSENPDSCGANKRSRGWSGAKLAPVPHIFVSPTPGCLCHILHRARVLVLREKTCIGDLHALAYSTSGYSRIMT